MTTITKGAKFKDTDIDAVPEDWEVLDVNSICEVIKNQYKPCLKDSLSYIGLEHIDQQSLRLNSIGESSDVTSNKFLFNSRDVLFGKLRPYFRKVYQPDFSGICSTDILVIRAKKNYDEKFLFYFIANQDFIEEAVSSSQGTRMPRANWDYLKNTEWPIPLLSEQKSIAEILSSLDEKIELNRRMNKTLEEMGKALFKRWFVDFEFPNKEGKPYKSSGGKMLDSELGEIPDGWRIGNLSEVTKVITKGTTPTTFGKNFTQSGINFIKVESLTDAHTLDKSKFSFIDSETNTLLLRSKVEEGDILFSIAGTIGRFAIASESDLPANTNQAVAILRANDVLDPYFIFYWFLVGLLNNDLLGNVVEAVQANLSLTSLSNHKIIIPTNSTLQLFKDTIKPLGINILFNHSNSEELSKIRDSILPKLISGKIRTVKL